MDVAAGTDADAMIAHRAAELLALRSGKAYETQFFSGGSEDRRLSMAACIAGFAAMGIKAVRQSGYAVVIGN